MGMCDNNLIIILLLLYSSWKYHQHNVFCREHQLITECWGIDFINADSKTTNAWQALVCIHTYLHQYSKIFFFLRFFRVILVAEYNIMQ